jgi:hypothetical protein
MLGARLARVRVKDFILMFGIWNLDDEEERRR